MKKLIELFIQLFERPMSPRRYDMTRKRAASEETRRKILEATLKLHSERGIFGTAWADIAREADVALGTVYRYFPTLDDLVPACGELLMERTRPPSPDEICAILGEAAKPAERLKRVADAVFSFYARAGTSLEADLRERELPAVREWEAYLRGMVQGFVAEALKDLALPVASLDRIVFLFDVPSFSAMRIRGFSPDEAAATATELAMAWLAQATKIET